MLSDEEKKAIDYIKENIVLFLIIEQRLKNNGKEMEKCDKEKIDNYKTILNLIEKRQKEIEHQKEKRENQKKELAILNAKQIEFNKLVNTVNSYKGQFKKQQKEIEELKNADLTTVYLNGFYDGEKKVKDKIKAKIEYYEKIDNPVGKRVLESLLEKE